MPVREWYKNVGQKYEDMDGEGEESSGSVGEECEESEKCKVEESGEEPADDELLEMVARTQIRANYRKSLGKEYLRKSWDEEIKRIFRKKKQ